MLDGKKGMRDNEGRYRIRRGKNGGTGMRRRRRKKGLQLFGIVLLLTLSAGAALLLTGWAMLERDVQLASVEVAGAAIVQDAGAAAAQDMGAAAMQDTGAAAMQDGTEGGALLQDAAEAKGKYAALLADPARMAAENAIPLIPGEEGKITLAFAGDILFDDGYSIMARMKSRAGGGSLVDAGFDAAILERMRGADIFMVNNEFTYTNRGTPIEGKSFTFRADPAHASLLPEMGADIVSLANNHSYDYGEISLLDTLDTLEAVGMPYVGAGRNLSEAVRPVYFVSENVKIAFLSSTQIERMDNPSTRGATETSPGVFRSRNVDLLLSEIEKAKAVSDFVVVYVHWGTESTSEPDWSQREQAPLIAQAGADLIIGDHPHVLQGIEFIGDTPVIYSVGNFLFNSRTLDTCLVEATLDAQTGGLVSFRFVPAIQKDCRTSLLTGGEKDRVIRYMQSLSPDVTIDAEGFVSPL